MYTEKEIMSLPSDRLMFILDEARHVLSEISDELAEAIINYKTLERFLPSILAEIQCEFLDKGCNRNESLDRARATQKYKDALNALQAAYDIKKPLEIKFELYNNNIKCLTSLAYLKNTEMKNGI